VGVLGWLLAALLGLVLAALLAPWHVRFIGRTAPLRGRVELRLFAGNAPAIPIPLGRSRKPGRKKRKHDRTEARSRKRKRSRPLPAGMLDLVFGVLSAIRFRRLRVAGRIGLEDPADTGVLWGHVAPFVYGLSAPGRDIEVAPDFSGPCLDLEAHGDVAILPIRLLRAGVAFGWANVRATA
jgi:hypothetical protein